MTWEVSVILVDADEDRLTVTHHIAAHDQAAAIGQALARQLPRELQPGDELLIFAQPTEGEDNPNDAAQVFMSNWNKPLTRERCLQNADTTAQPEVAAYWRNIAPDFKPEAEGGGHTDEAAQRRKQQDEAWRKRQQTPRR